MPTWAPDRRAPHRAHAPLEQRRGGLAEGRRPVGVGQRHDGDQRAAQRDGEQLGRRPHEGRVSPAAVQQPVEHVLAGLVVHAGQPELFLAVALRDRGALRVVGAPDHAGDLQQQGVVLAAAGARDVEQRLPDRLTAQPVGAQHGFQRDGLRGPSASDVAGVAAGGVGVAGGGADECVDPTLEVGAGGRPHLLLAVAQHLAVRRLGPQEDVDHPVGHGVQLVDQQRGELGEPGRDLGSKGLHSISS